MMAPRGRIERRHGRTGNCVDGSKPERATVLVLDWPTINHGSQVFGHMLNLRFAQGTRTLLFRVLDWNALLLTGGGILRTLWSLMFPLPTRSV